MKSLCPRLTACLLVLCLTGDPVFAGLPPQPLQGIPISHPECFVAEALSPIDAWSTAPIHSADVLGVRNKTARQIISKDLSGDKVEALRPTPERLASLLDLISRQTPVRGAGCAVVYDQEQVSYPIVEWRYDVTGKPLYLIKVHLPKGSENFPVANLRAVAHWFRGYARNHPARKVYLPILQSTLSAWTNLSDDIYGKAYPPYEEAKSHPEKQMQALLQAA
jgi:hypothetical protein